MVPAFLCILCLYVVIYNVPAYKTRPPLNWPILVPYICIVPFKTCAKAAQYNLFYEVIMQDTTAGYKY